MKQIRTYLTTLCILLLAVGCTKEMETATPNPTDVTSLIKIGDFPAFDEDAQTRAIGTPDPGKTAWADGDSVLVFLTNKSGIKENLALRYNASTKVWNANSKINFGDYRNAICDVRAYYAPACVPNNDKNDPNPIQNPGWPHADSPQLRAMEYLTHSQEGVNLRNGITINFANATRTYSRLRVATDPGAIVRFTPSNGIFIVPGFTSVVADATTFTTKADANGNAFFYGTWTASTFKFNITKGDKTFDIEKTIAATSIPGKGYAVAGYADPLPDMVEMRMTVKVKENETFTLPFSGSIGDYSLYVDWGDDSNLTIFKSGTTPSEEERTHRYPPIGEGYTITISTTQTNAAEKQMPQLRFYESSASTKLYSLDTPLLNMGVTSLAENFSGCTGLITICEGLFDNNTQVTDFYKCFYGCKKLTAIPAGLFAKNSEATEFSSCFYGCTSLTAIPAGLFAKNSEATEFNSCFFQCGKAKLDPNIFCNEAEPGAKETRFAGKAMNFGSCFLQCNGGGTAPALWEYKNMASVVSALCFFNVTKVTNANNIPENWKN